MAKNIPLSSGVLAIVDDEDYEWLTETKWADDSRGYAIRKVKGRNSTEKMHRLIMNAEPGMSVDHINGIPWDNRKENLRLVSTHQNGMNKSLYPTNKSGYKGVAVYRNGMWTAQITVNYKKIHLGVFKCKREAAIAYNKAAIEHFGEFAKLNVINEKTG